MGSQIKSETGIKYLNVDNYSKYGHRYVVRVIIKGKHFIVWHGNDETVGKKVAEKVQELMSISKAAFLDWYDNDAERWLELNVKS